MTKLSNYLVRLETILLGRSDITIESLRTEATPEGASFRAEVRFFDGSWLSISELLEQVSRGTSNRLYYRFHYRAAEGELVFRYDNRPHHPHLDSYPHHKHIGRQVIESNPPDLTDILAEIDEILYGTSG